VVPRIAVAVPLNRDVYGYCYQNHLGLISYTLLSGAARVEHFICPRGYIIEKARNLVVEKALKLDVEYIFWIDQDVMVPSNAIERLLAHDKVAVSGLYFLKKEPYVPCMYDFTPESLAKGIFSYPEKWDDGLIETGLVGMGCMLTKVSVFREYGPPWFRITKANITEDVYFCQQLRILGYKPYVDTTLKCWHVGDRVIIGEVDFLAAKGLLSEKISET